MKCIKLTRDKFVIIKAAIDYFGEFAFLNKITGGGNLGS